MRLTKKQRAELDETLEIVAKAFAKEMSKSLRDALNTNNLNLLVTEVKNDTEVQTLFFYHESVSSIRQGILNIVTDMVKELKALRVLRYTITSYEGFTEDLQKFKEIVSEELPDGWTCIYGEEDEVLALRTERIAEHV